MYALRDKAAAAAGMELIVHRNPEAEAKGINPIDHGSALHTQMWKTDGLRQALDAHGFDAAIGGARRDEEKVRAKERIFSFRSAGHRWDPKRQRPSCGGSITGRKAPARACASSAVQWTELDVWQYVEAERWRSLRSISRRGRRSIETAISDGATNASAAAGRGAARARVRFRTLGCYPLPARRESRAANVAELIAEMARASSERQGR